eukprot:TRINITY_DN3730_c0_g1_i26.p1 TRINITY_DN3730_c0_g1~~TRINITY_DN3730_c0_g1_i26.p1  ORF type:complete len:358 (+),score=58.64 TRINITY_DN3730_c0_g1_i26:671-1744(+)
MYYWRIESDNGLMKVSSPVLNFTTLASGCPSLNCVAGNSLCNQTLLSPACQCLTGWSGTTCATAICASSCGQHGVHCAQPVHLFAGLLGPNLQHQGSLGLGLGPRARRRCCGDCHSGAARRWHLLSAQVPRPGPVLQEPQDARLCAACLGDVTPVTERDEIAKALVYVFEDATCNVAFQRYLVDCEVKIAELESTLFRANGLSKIVGLPYLFRTLALLLNEIVDVANSEEQKKLRDTNEGKGARGSSVQLLEIDTRAENLFSGDMEIDPSKMKGDQDALTNMLALQLVCQKILVQIRRSVPRVPRLRHNPDFCRPLLVLSGCCSFFEACEDGQLFLCFLGGDCWPCRVFFPVDQDSL